jgi:hypothetical protein
MRKIDIFNEVLLANDEPAVATTNEHGGVRKMNLWFKTVGRELTDSYEIPESLVVLSSSSLEVPSTSFPDIGRVNYTAPPNSEQHPDRVVKITEGVSQNFELTQVSLTRLIELRDQNPTTRLAQGQAGRYFAMGLMPENGTGGFPTAASAAPRVCVWPMPPTVPVLDSLTLNLRMVFRRNLLVSMADTDYCPYPSHLVILGLKWYFRMDRSGSDDPETVQAREAYRNGVASHVAFAASLEGSPMSGWEPT